MRAKSFYFKKITVGFISLLVLFLGFSLESHLVAVSLVIIYSLLISFLFSRESILDPRSLFLIMLAVYSTWFSLQVIIFGYEGPLTIDSDILLSSIRLQMFGIVVFVLVCMVMIDESSVSLSRRAFFDGLSVARKEYLSEKAIFWPVLLFVLFALVVTAGGGHTTKREILDSGSVLKSVAELFFYILLVLVMLGALRRGKRLVTYKAVIVVFVGLGYLLLLGERDIFFRAAILMFLLFVDKKNMPAFLSVLFVVILAVTIVPLSQGLKAVFLSGDIDFAGLDLSLVFSNEFISAGRNLYSLMYYGVDNSFSFIFNDVLRAFVPSFFLSGAEIQSTSSWFDSVYRVENGFQGTSGWGFSIMAQGYLVSGYFGVFLIMAIAASILSLLYRRSYDGEYWYIFYLMALTTYVYIIRADFANLLSQVFKIGGLAVVGVYFTHYLFSKLKKRPI
ncbi:oligosaccharide repeat unit polymerase [Pseudomonas sp. ABC1]|uniref:O-antigen polymerase n=1 Tax=Pseudomonas sp. ABC1 TaxID=2748080 RepID=UPI0015C3FD98|nr:O-antigen polymerase [Pseudomonas sp. ABC1]QLF94493.1 oligosaccharide repeat unit polymerase [Pseudomonas sp. ABC1]